MNRGPVPAIGVLVASLLLAFPTWASQPAGPVTIETLISFADFPFSGTFSVTEGAVALGCSGGTFVDHPSGFEPPTRGNIAKIFTCTQGATGTFVANFQPQTGKPGPGDGNGHWNITEATNDFSGLHGQGDFSLVVADDFLSGVETLTGDIHFEP